jgi:hypothetical protein
VAAAPEHAPSTSAPPTAAAEHPTPPSAPGAEAAGHAASPPPAPPAARGWLARAGAALAVLAGALLLRVITGVGFANYDTLYALVWGQQAARGEVPQYGLPIAPTPHPLVEAAGVVLAPLGPRATEGAVVALGFLALAVCAWAVYRLGALWFNRAAGAVAAAVLVTRVPVLSYGTRAYVDVPYLALVLGALVLETRRPRAGAPVLGLLALAGLLRPEAWAFSAGYWAYLAWPTVRAHRRARGLPHGDPHPHEHDPGGPHPDDPHPHGHHPGGPHPDGLRPRERTPRELAWLAGLAVAAPAVWVASDWLVTGHPAWSLTNTRHTATELHRETGPAKVPEYVPRRIGEVLGAAGLAAAVTGGLLAWAWLRARATPGLVTGAAAVAVFALLGAAGLPIDERYAFLAAAVGCVFAGAAVCGWAELPRGSARRRWWAAAAAAVALVLVATAPAQYRVAHRQLQALARQQQAQDDLTALVRAGAVSASCEPVGVPNHAPVPLLALWLRTPPARIVSAQVQAITHGTYVEPATTEVQRNYILDPLDPHRPVHVPAGFTLARTDRSWRIYRRCPRAGGG